jgi:DNA-binding XRE family transcriptional regulator
MTLHRKENEIMTRLEVLRRARGVTRSQLANLIGVHYPSLCNFEHGYARTPGKWQAIIAKALEASVDEVFDARGFAREVSE